MEHLLWWQRSVEVTSEKPPFVVWYVGGVPVRAAWKCNRFWSGLTLLLWFSWTVWGVFAAHDETFPVRWGAACLYSPLRQKRPRGERLEEELYPQLVKTISHFCTWRCVCVWLCGLELWLLFSMVCVYLCSLVVNALWNWNVRLN